jgi:hypothetical protein
VWRKGVQHKLWTFKVSGPGGFAIQPPGNPSAFHSGGDSVFHFFITDAQAAYVKQTLEDLELKVVMREMAGQSNDQHAERMLMLGRGKTAEDFPSPMCPSCFWFDPLIVGACGRSSWPTETVVASIEVHEAARKGEADCPVTQWK